MGSRRLAFGLIALGILWFIGLGINRWVDTSGGPAAAPASSREVAAPGREAPREAQPIAPSSILGSRIPDVDRLLRGWAKSEHGAGPGYFKYDSDVRLVVRYRNGVAVGVAALSLRNRAISVTRGAELARLVGEPPRDVNHLNGELHEIYFGDI